MGAGRHGKAAQNNHMGSQHLAFFKAVPLPIRAGGSWESIDGPGRFARKTFLMLRIYLSPLLFVKRRELCFFWSPELGGTRSEALLTIRKNIPFVLQPRKVYVLTCLRSRTNACRWAMMRCDGRRLLSRSVSNERLTLPRGLLLLLLFPYSKTAFHRLVSQVAKPIRSSSLRTLCPGPLAIVLICAGQTLEPFKACGIAWSAK